jgi:hypothetical protein
MSAGFHIDAPIIGWPEAAGQAEPRRLRWISSLGIKLVSFFAQAAGGASSSSRPGSSAASYADAAAQPCNTTGTCTPVRCCCLACADKECPYVGKKSDFTCPGGTKTFWTCTEGSKLIGCGECAGGSSCFDKPWYCSISYEIN